MPRSPHSLNTAAAEASARSQACWLRCWEPTWNDTPCGSRPEPEGVLQHVHRHGRLAAELARQRPFGADAVGQDAAEHARAGRRAGDLLDLGLAVDRVEADAERVGARDIALLLDGVAIRDAVGRGAGGQHHLDLGDRGGVEAGAELGQQRQHLRRRVCLHRVEHAGVGQRLGEGGVVVAARRRGRRQGRALRRCGSSRKSRMRSVIGAIPLQRGATERPVCVSSEVKRLRALGTRKP